MMNDFTTLPQLPLLDEMTISVKLTPALNDLLNRVLADYILSWSAGIPRRYNSSGRDITRYVVNRGARDGINVNPKQNRKYAMPSSNYVFLSLKEVAGLVARIEIFREKVRSGDKSNCTRLIKMLENIAQTKVTNAYRNYEDRIDEIKRTAAKVAETPQFDLVWGTSNNQRFSLTARESGSGYFARRLGEIYIRFNATIVDGAPNLTYVVTAQSWGSDEGMTFNDFEEAKLAAVGAINMQVAKLVETEAAKIEAAKVLAAKLAA